METATDTTASGGSSVNQDTPLLELPAELRNQIYRYALVSNGAIRIRRQEYKSHTALLKVCSQIRKEAIKIFFTENRFRSISNDHRLGTTFKWMEMIGKENAACILQLAIRIKIAERCKESGHVMMNSVLPEDYGEARAHNMILVGRLMKTLNRIPMVMDSAGFTKSCLVVDMQDVAKAEIDEHEDLTDLLADHGIKYLDYASY